MISCWYTVEIESGLYEVTKSCIDACFGIGTALALFREIVRAAQASPDHGFCGVRATGLVSGDPSRLELRSSCARRQEPPSRARGCGWDGGAARERSSALAASVASRYALGADGVWALRARAPVVAGSLPHATRSAPKAGALRAWAPTCAPRVTAHVVSWGEWGCRRSCVLRAAREARCKACFELLPRARVGWHTARTLLPPPPPRSSGAPVRWLMARGLCVCV